MQGERSVNDFKIFFLCVIVAYSSDWIHFFSGCVLLQSERHPETSRQGRGHRAETRWLHQGFESKILLPSCAAKEGQSPG